MTRSHTKTYNARCNSTCHIRNPVTPCHAPVARQFQWLYPTAHVVSSYPDQLWHLRRPTKTSIENCSGLNFSTTTYKVGAYSTHKYSWTWETALCTINLPTPFRWVITPPPPQKKKKKLIIIILKKGTKGQLRSLFLQLGISEKLQSRQGIIHEWN